MSEEQAREELKALLELRIARGLAGDLSTKSIAQIVAEELDREGLA